MEKKYRVFIKGIPGRGEEVIKILTDLVGGTVSLDGSNKDCIYFLDHDGTIDFEYLGSEMARIIMDNYTELHLPEQWKKGDILVNKNANYKFCVFDDYLSRNGSGKDLFFFYCEVARHKGEKYLESNNRRYFHDVNDYRLATTMEVEQFHEALHTYHKEWNAEKKQLVNLKWKPKNGEEYWTVIVGIANKLKFTWFGTKDDEARYKLGNCFKTREEAEVMAEKVKKLFLQNYEKTKENS